MNLSDGRFPTLTFDGLEIFNPRDDVTQNTARGDYIEIAGDDIVRNFSNDGCGWDGDDLLIQRTCGKDFTAAAALIVISSGSRLMPEMI